VADVIGSRAGCSGFSSPRVFEIQTTNMKLLNSFKNSLQTNASIIQGTGSITAIDG